MSKKGFLMAAFVCAFLLNGCAVQPGWVRAEEEKFYTSRPPAIYGIGAGATRFSAAVEGRQAVARMNARRNLAEARSAYVERTLEILLDRNADWFQRPAFDEEIADIAEYVSGDTLFPVEFVERWKDTRFDWWGIMEERREQRGTIFVLARQELDTPFYDVLLEAVGDYLADREEQLLETDVETVLGGLEELLAGR